MSTAYLEFGTRVLITAKFIRTKSGNKRKWEAVDIEPRQGIYIGVRTLSDGVMEDGVVYRSVRRFPAAIVAVSTTESPILVPFIRVEEV